jgi:hypothetical protein
MKQRVRIKDLVILFTFFSLLSYPVIAQDTTPPSIQFVSPSDENNSFINRDWSYVNASIEDQNITSGFINWNKCLVLYLKLDSVNASNYTLDSSLYGNHGQLRNGTTSCYDDPGCPQLVSGMFGNGLYLEDYNWVKVLDSPSLDVTEAFTIEFWVKPSSFVAMIRIIVDKSGAYSVSEFSDGVILKIWSGGSEYNTNPTSELPQ